MSRKTLLACVLVATLAAAPSAMAQRARGLTVVNAGNEPALKLGATTLSRPFGGQLVDRITVVGGYGPARMRQYLVRGEGGGDCPARYLIVETVPGSAPKVSAPFGTCTLGASATHRARGLEISMPAATSGAPQVRYVYADGVVRPLDLAAANMAAALPEGAALSCAAGDDQLAPEPVADALDRDFPDEFRRAGSIRQLDITPPEMRAIVGRLACLSTRPGADPVVYQTAAPLFASKRYGQAAFDALDSIPRLPGADTGLNASIAQFRAQMYYFVGRREPL